MNLSSCKIRKSGLACSLSFAIPELMRNLMYITLAFKCLIYANISVKCVRYGYVYYYSVDYTYVHF